MEILRSNFKENFDLIKSSIDEATFLAIDCEFTGLNEEWNLKAYDTPSERYEKIKDGAMQFLVIQFGLCAFKHNKTSDNYTHKAFNFYIFPRSFGRDSPDPRFYCQSSSLEFLASQGFDFNKLLKEGIPFLTSKDEDIIKEKLMQKHSEEEKQRIPLNSKSKTAQLTNEEVIAKVPKEHETFIKAIFSKIKNYLANGKEGNTISLPSCTAYQRKLIYETVRPAFNTDDINLQLETINADNGDKYIRVSRQSPEEAKARLLDRQVKEMEELDEALGFTKVVRAISQSKKLVIGHNMLLDLMHLVHQFCTPLPETYEEFKNLGHGLFPNLLDTKVMSSSNPLKEYFSNTALNLLLKRTREKPFKPVVVEPEENFEGCYKTSSEQLHEAGYDAYITGLCYLSMANYLGTVQKSKKKAKHIFPDHPLIQAFTNKLFMMRSPDIPYLNLQGPDLQPDRSHVFHVTFPKEWKTSDLIDLFSPCGNSFVSWIDQESAFVSLKNPTHADNAKTLLTSGSYQGHVKILTYEEYNTKKLKRKMNDNASSKINLISENNKKRKCDEGEQASSPKEVKSSSEIDLGDVVSRVEIPEDNEKPSVKKTGQIFQEVETWN